MWLTLLRCLLYCVCNQAMSLKHACKLVKNCSTDLWAFQAIKKILSLSRLKINNTWQSSYSVRRIQQPLSLCWFTIMAKNLSPCKSEWTHTGRQQRANHPAELRCGNKQQISSPSWTNWMGFQPSFSSILLISLCLFNSPSQLNTSCLADLVRNAGGLTVHS